MAGKIIHGINAVREALNHGGIVNRLYFAKESPPRGHKSMTVLAKNSGVPIDFVPQAKLNDLARTREHQGVAAAVSPVEYVTLDECLAACPKTATLVVCDQIQHEKNLGLIIRTAVGAGASGVVLTARKGVLLDDAVVRASAGAVFKVPVVCEENLRRALAELKEHGFWIYGLDAAGPQTIFDVNWPDRCALVVGNESSGLRPTIKKECDECVSIPVANDLDSLNAAVATGVALYQIVAARKDGPADLTPGDA